MVMNKKTNHELRKFVAPEFIFGNGSRKLSVNYARNLGGRKIFLATDSGVEKTGWGSEIAGLLENEGFEIVLFDDISPNPRDYEVMKGAEFYLASQCDVIVAVGGGSVMDSSSQAPRPSTRRTGRAASRSERRVRSMGLSSVESELGHRAAEGVVEKFRDLAFKIDFP